MWGKMYSSIKNNFKKALVLRGNLRSSFSNMSQWIPLRHANAAYLFSKQLTKCTVSSRSLKSQVPWEEGLQTAGFRNTAPSENLTIYVRGVCIGQEVARVLGMRDNLSIRQTSGNCGIQPSFIGTDKQGQSHCWPSAQDLLLDSKQNPHSQPPPCRAVS